MRARRRLFLAAALLAVLAFAACTLNPQPLPPGDDDRANAAEADDAGSGFGGGADSGRIEDPQGPDAGGNPPPVNDDAGVDADAGDAATDAPTDAPDGG